MEPLEGTRSLLSSVSTVSVVEDVILSHENVYILSNTLAEYFVDSEIIIVANGVNDELALALKKIVAQTPDATCLFLAERMDTDIACIVGIDHSIGDYVILATPTKAEISALEPIIDEARKGFDLVVARSNGNRVGNRWLYSVPRNLFLRLIRFLTGVTCDLVPSSLRLLSRSAALHILSQRHAELLLKSSTIGGGFPSKVLEKAFEETNDRSQRRMSRSLNKGLRAIVSSGTISMRLASIAALLTGGLAFLYSLYVVATYLFKPDVAPGWTTVSLQVSGMMFLFSLIFLLLAEYIIQIYEGMPVSRRRLVIREFNSEQSRRSCRRNVVDGYGQFQLGAPQEFPEVVPSKV